MVSTSPLTNNEAIVSMISVLTHVFTQFTLETFLSLVRYVTSFNHPSYLQGMAKHNNISFT